MKWKDFDSNKNPFPETIRIIVDWLWFMSNKWEKIDDKNKFIEQNLQPLLNNGIFRDPKIEETKDPNNIIINCELKFPSPALGTLLRHFGFIDDNFNISKLVELIANNKLTIAEYLLINLSKHRGWFDDEKPKVNFLVLLCIYLKENNYCEITEDKLLYISKLDGYDLNYNPSIDDASRNDILYNYIKGTTLFNEIVVNKRSLTIKQEAKEIIDFIANNKEIINIDLRTSKSDRYIYYGDIESGIFKLKGLNLPNNWSLFYPNLLKSNNNINDVIDISINTLVSIKTKPFIILAGLSGTGKSRMVRTLAYHFNNINDDKLSKKNPPTNFLLLKVKPNWHDSSEILGYESRISGKDRLIVTDFLRYIVKAWQHPNTPFFLCLDEMNLAPVEQYFAEYLSVIETRRTIDGKIKTDPLISSNLIIKYADKLNGTDPVFDLWKELDLEDKRIQEELKNYGIGLPSNLIVMGTVNMDETTHSFSRKVLDRAMTIEMNDINLYEGLSNDTNAWFYPTEPMDSELVLSDNTQGYEVFEALGPSGETIIEYLNLINEKMESSPFKIAYRVRDEFLLYAYNYYLFENKKVDWMKNVLDEMTLMKILPRIEGDEDRTKLLDDLIIIFREKDLPKSLNKATEMVNRRINSHYTTFWV
jgi:hypothetical protein